MISKQITKMISGEFNEKLEAIRHAAINNAFGQSWRKWSAVKSKKSGIWVLTHNETGHTVRSHDRTKAEKKMAQFHAIHVKLTR